MLKKLSVLSFAALLSVFLFSFSIQAATSEKAKNLAQQAVSANATEAKTAIAELRAMNAEGLDALFEVYTAQIANYLAGKEDANWAKIANAIDSVAMQKDSYAARLYWHTNFEKAKKHADKENKPILSLRLLGNLNEEFSCANSRFFRTILYANAGISKILREKYVLHWQSVRPAPKVTIDFGDGRKIERTITGNSIHYVLDENGKPLDALPGLYSPQVFEQWLLVSDRAHKTLQTWEKLDRVVLIKRFHQTQLGSLGREWRGKLERAESEIAAETGKPPTAIQAAPIAVAKMVTEESILRDITTDISRLELSTNLDEWKKMAGFQVDKTQFDPNSIGLIQRQLRESSPNSERMTKLLANLKTYVALDTVRNDYLLRTKLHQWFARGEVSDLENFNERVYTELFLTPRSDEWLGLYSPEVYTALDGEGIK